jgi:2-polyprenyl-3-methyl-5-hydroxy-6-metoxy-1,4-benzoquinol methylase
MDFRDQIYASYGAFKGWDDQGLSEVYYDLYAGEMRQHNVDMQGSLLEIGFGSAHFLKWATNQGLKTVGVEVNESFVKSAQQQGLEVYHLPLQKMAELSASVKKFNAIVILDVLEHLYPDEILNLFRSIYPLLETGGKVVCRFPNGLSPFATQTQWADMTHVTVLTPERMRQVGIATGFEVVHSCNSYRSLKVGKRSAFVKRVLYTFRNVFETIVGVFYFGGRVPLDPNLSISLVKK